MATSSSPLHVTPAPRIQRGWRLFVFYSSALALTGVVSLMFADLLWRSGWSASRTMLLILFIVLFFLISLGCMHGLFGFVLLTFGTRKRLTQLKDYHDQIIAVSTAIVFPIHNEDVVRAYAGLRATFESLKKTGQLEYFDFFILSDSTNPDKWIEEERRWFDLIRELDALGKPQERQRA